MIYIIYKLHCFLSLCLLFYFFIYLLTACFVKTVKRLLSTVAVKGSIVYEYDQIKPFTLNDDNVEIRYWNSYVNLCSILNLLVKQF